MKFKNSLPACFPEVSCSRPIRILFVCLGNICRSPAAEATFKALIDKEGLSSYFYIDSAGTGNYHIGQLPDKRMRVHGRRRDLDINHICRQVNSDDFNHFDLIVGMDDSNISDLREKAPSAEAEKKIVPMACWFGSYSHYDYVPDPYYEGAEGFELVLDMLSDGCKNLLDSILQR